MQAPPLRFVVALLALSAVADAAAQVLTPDLGGYVTLANGYWHRGLSQTDGASLQLGVDYRHRSGWFVGGRAANVDYSVEQNRPEPREIELNAYTGYHGRRDAWTWTTNLSYYAYPGAGGDPDYLEIEAGFGFRDRVFYTASYSDDLVRNNTTLNQEISIVWPAPAAFEVSASVGRFDFERIPADYNYWNAGVSRVCGPLVVDVRYYDNDYPFATSLGSPAGDSAVLSLTYPFGRR